MFNVFEQVFESDKIIVVLIIIKITIILISVLSNTSGKVTGISNVLSKIS